MTAIEFYLIVIIASPQRHEEFSERTAATVMSAFDPSGHSI
jgi:hypothetical protein